MYVYGTLREQEEILRVEKTEREDNSSCDMEAEGSFFGGGRRPVGKGDRRTGKNTFPCMLI